jgi:hypothetical protein
LVGRVATYARNVRHMGWVLIALAVAVTSVRLLVDRRVFVDRDAGRTARLSRYWLVAWLTASPAVLIVSTVAVGLAMLGLGILLIAAGL